MPWSTRTARSEARPCESPYSTTESRWRIDGVRGGEGPPPRSCPKAKLLLHGDRNVEHHETAIGVDDIGVTTVGALALIADLQGRPDRTRSHPGKARRAISPRVKAMAGC